MARERSPAPEPTVTRRRLPTGQDLGPWSVPQPELTMVVMPFLDRVDAGRRLAAALCDLRGENVVVLGLPRGGVPVAYEVAAALAAPLDVIVVRKLGVPFQPELAMGAIGECGVRVLNYDVVRMAGVTRRDLALVEERERGELERRADRFRAGRVRVGVRGRTVIIVDDGAATGSTAKAACRVAKALGAGRVVVAVPVASPGAIAELSDHADEVICVEAPEDLWSVGQWYRNFTQTTDDEVVALLKRAEQRTGHGGPGDDPVGDDSPVADQGRMRCEARLAVVPGAGHLFEEPGTLAAAGDLARRWFAAHLFTSFIPAHT